MNATSRTRRLVLARRDAADASGRDTSRTVAHGSSGGRGRERTRLTIRSPWGRKQRARECHELQTEPGSVLLTAPCPQEKTPPIITQ
jgi:hypothetical protein